MEVLKKTWAVLKKNGYFSILSLIFFGALVLLWGRFGDPVVDCGREAYIPFAMADLGKVLFKDIVCIYGPVPYYINALVVKLFGASFGVMQAIGAFFAYMFLFLFYSFSKRFFGAAPAFFMSFLVLVSCVFSVHIFNYIFPYSYAMLYALVFSLLALFFIFKYSDTKKAEFLYLTAFFLSLCILSKYDFLPLILILPLILLLYRKNISSKNILCILFSFFVPFFALILILLIQKVTVSDFLFNFKMISNMAHAPSLEYFYKTQTGFHFVPEKLIKLLKPSMLSLIMFGIFFFSAFYLCKVKYVILRYGTLSLLLIFSLICFRPVFFLFPLIIFLAFFGRVVYLLVKKRLFSIPEEEIPEYLFVFFTILISLKTLFDLNLDVYGTFYLPCVLLSFYILLFLFFKPTQISRSRYLCGINFLNIVLSAFFLFYTVKYYAFTKVVPVKTPMGTMYSVQAIAEPSNFAIRFLEQKLKKNESFLMLPEGLFFNFVFKNEYKYFNTSFTPLDFDAYGEEYLIKSVMENLPKYLLITNRNTEEYGYAFICRDYGLNFCAALNNMYEFRAASCKDCKNGDFAVHIFERKDK